MAIDHELLVHEVTDATFGPATGLSAGTLTVDEEAARSRVLGAAEGALAEVRLTWAHPGTSTRLVKVLDAVEPRAKEVEGPGGADCFPGFVGPPVAVGRGRTHALAGVAVVVAGYLPRAQESVVDMSGPAAPLSPLAATHNLVVEFTPAEGARWEDVDAGLRRGQLRLARDLAAAALGAEPDATRPWPPPTPAGRGRPRIGAVTNIQTQGRFKDVFVHGRSYAEGLPTLLELAEVLDGAVVSGQFGHPALKNPTYLHQHHPVAHALLARHGVDLEFAGVVVAPEPVDALRKELVSEEAARLCRAAGWDAAIVTKEGGGNADGDMALKMDALEAHGLVAVGIFAEMSGADGTGPPVVVPPSAATAMVSAGNYDERIELPAVEVALGGERLALLDVEATAAVTLPAAVVYGANSPLGWGRLTARPATEVPGAGGGPLREHDGPVRVVHYINQFFAGMGGEDSADAAPERRDGPQGPGRKLAALLGDGFAVTHTVVCGDDRATSGPEALAEVLALVAEVDPDLVVAGPAFTSGRYGLACARLAAMTTAAGLPTVAAMHPDNPGIDEAGTAVVVAAGEAARTMGPSLETVARAVTRVASGQGVGPDEGRVGKVARRNVLADAPAAARAVDVALARLAGDREATEVPLPRFDHVHPAPPVEDLTTALVALVTEGALVPEGNPDGLESARATRWCRYSLDGVDALATGAWQSVHGGFSTQWANDDPHRILPLDVARELAAEGRIGALHAEYLTTAGNGTSVANARRFGVEWAADLRHSEARAAILTST